MEVGDAHRHQHLRLCEVHGSLVFAYGGADGVGIRRAVRRLGLSFGAMASPGPRGAELGGKIVAASFRCCGPLAVRMCTARTIIPKIG